jgi:hypothetical protein
VCATSSSARTPSMRERIRYCVRFSSTTRGRSGRASPMGPDASAWAPELRDTEVRGSFE